MKKTLQIVNNEIFQTAIFFVVLLIVMAFAGYFDILFTEPHSIHFIRQTDSLSFASNYFRNGMNFFEPATFNLSSINGKAACEFPLLYYITAVFYHIFGENPAILRSISIIIVFSGFYFLYKALLLVFKDLTYSLAISFLIISSGILLFYANNFLPDAPAFGFAISAWAFAVFFHYNKKHKHLIISFLFFLISALLKVTYSINFLSLTAVLLIWQLFYKKILSQKDFKLFIALLIVFLLLVSSWNLWVLHYNQVNNDRYFLTSATPLWEMTGAQIDNTLDYLTNYWRIYFYYPSTLHFFIIASLFVIVFARKSPRFLWFVNLFILLGSISFGILFFQKFTDHDYYLITFIPLLLITTVNFFLTFKNKFPKIYNSIYTKLIFVVLVVLSVNYSIYNFHRRYNHKFYYEDIAEKMPDIVSYFNKNKKLNTNTVFYVFGDETYNGSLYFLKSKGYTFANTEAYKRKKNNLIKPDFVINLSDSLPLSKNIKQELNLRLQKEINGKKIYESIER